MALPAAVVAAAPNANWLRTIRDPENANLELLPTPQHAGLRLILISIVAVHGMNVGGADNHAENTWVDEESGTHWLNDLLPEVLPKARILAYQYNANVVFRTSVAGVKEQADNLLHCLHSERNHPSRAVRPIIFIAHSMGGILVKEALATAFHSSQRYSSLWIFTYGIVFFGVPHQGSRHAAWGRMAAQMVQLFTGQPNDSFLSSVEEGSDYNVHLIERFSPLLDAFKFFSICETLPERVGLIVETDSAVLGLPDSQEVKLHPNRTHRKICKFAGTDPEWQQISSILVYGAACAVNYTAYSPVIATRQMTVIPLDREEMPAGPFPSEQAIDQAVLSIATGERILTELHRGEAQIRDGFYKELSWFWSILSMFLSAFTPFFLPSLLLPSAGIIMYNAERASQSQRRLIEFQEQAIERLDAHRTDVLEHIVRLRSPSVHGWLPPDGLQLALRMEVELSRQAELIIRDLNGRYRMMPEERRRLRRIEDGQREAQGMDNRQLLEMIGRRVEEERDILEARQAEARQAGEPVDEACGPCCIIL